MMKRALMNASVASMICVFNMDNIQLLEEKGYKVDIACNFGKENPISKEKVENFKNILKSKNICAYDTSCPRSVFSIGKILKSYKELKKISGNNYDLVHTQSPIGGVVCRLAFRKARKKGTKVIYTAHGFHFYKGSPIKNWLIYYPIEKLCSYFTDILITINKEDYDLAKRKMHAREVLYVPGAGLDTKKFNDIEVDRNEKRKSLGLTNKNIVLISVGELNDNKNQQVIIEAMHKIKEKNIHYLIVGVGEKREYLEELVQSLGLSENVHFLGYRKDVGELCRISDIFCFPSRREGLGIAALEAMSCGLPLITSNIHGIKDYSKNEISGFSCDVNDIDQYANAIKKLAGSESLIKEYGQNNINIVGEFDIKNVRKKMKSIYFGEAEKKMDLLGEIK